MINKLYERLKLPKIEKHEEDLKQDVIQKEFNLELKTMQFLFYYINYEEVIEKIYNAITE